MIECQKCFTENDDDANWCKKCKHGLWQSISRYPPEIVGNTNLIPSELKNCCLYLYEESRKCESVFEKSKFVRSLLSLIRSSAKISNEQEAIINNIELYIHAMTIELDRLGDSYHSEHGVYHADNLKNITNNALEYCKNMMQCGYSNINSALEEMLLQRFKFIRESTN